MSEELDFVSKPFADVMLTEDDINSIINGNKIYKQTPSGEKISISQTLLVKALIPKENHESKVVNHNIGINPSALGKAVAEIHAEQVAKSALSWGEQNYHKSDGYFYLKE